MLVDEENTHGHSKGTERLAARAAASSDFGGASGDAAAAAFKGQAMAFSVQGQREAPRWSEAEEGDEV
jgi:hypothetical protein